MKYTTYIFDFDFTLADATIGIVNSFNYAFNNLNMESKDRDSIRKTVGITLGEAFTVLTGISDKQYVDRFVAYFKEKADQVMTDNTVLFPDTIKTLSQLKSKNCNTAIVTSKLHYRIEEVLEKYGITDLIDYIVGFDDVVVAKPSPEGLLKAIQHFEENKKNILYVGDSLIDAKAAANAAVDFAAVTTGTTECSDFSSYPYVWMAKNLKELYHYIDDTVLL